MSEMLLLDVEAHLKQTGMSATEFGRLAVNDGSFVGALRRGLAVGPRREARVRAAIDGSGGVAATVAAEAEASVTRRRLAKQTGGTRAGKLAARPERGLVERITTMMMEDPSDAVVALKRRWPDLWAEILEAARSAGVFPGQMMVDAIEAGLASIASQRRAA